MKNIIPNSHIFHNEQRINQITNDESANAWYLHKRLHCLSHWSVADNGKVVQQVHMYDKPKSSTPNTGVPGPNPIYFTGAITSGLGIILLLRKKKQSK